MGLVDELGGLQAAIDIAAEMAEVTDYSLYELPKFENSLERLLKSLEQTSLSEGVIKEEMGEYYKTYKQIKDIRAQEGMLAKMPVEIRIQ